MVQTLTENEVAGRKYWEQFCKGVLASEKRLTPNRVDSPRRLQINHHPDVHLETVRIIKPRNGRPRTIGVWLILEGKDRTAQFNRLFKDKDAIEQRISTE